jgi:transglutaminase-like putative cysteine protease
MRLRVKHQTVYHYDGPIAAAIQTLRLMPRSYDGLTVLSWHVSSDARRELPSYIDGYGNVTHCHAVNHPHASAAWQ